PDLDRHLPGHPRELASAARQWAAALRPGQLASGLALSVRNAREEPGVLGLDLADGLSRRRHGAGADRPRHCGRGSAAGLLTETGGSAAKQGQDGGVLHLSRLRSQHRAGILPRDGALGRVLQPLPERLSSLSACILKVAETVSLGLSRKR